MKCDKKQKKSVFLNEHNIRKDVVQIWRQSDQFGFPGSKLTGENYFGSKKIHLRV